MSSHPPKRSQKPAPGTVYIVGAGPGDPGLLTVRGKSLLESAGAVVYDSLINEVLLEHAPQADKIFVGKRAGGHSVTQEDINRILVEQARLHSCVVRLKGGDPFIFGRGSEEALELAKHGIPFEVVPGVSAGSAVPAFAGIPVTHRGKSASVTFITGKTGDERGAAVLQRLHLDGTLVFFMPSRNMQAITQELIRLGRPPETPAAAIQWGTFGRQTTLTASLSTLAQRCEERELGAPLLVVVGEVVELRSVISWFENRSLYGRRVAVTHTRNPDSSLVSSLRNCGAEVFEFPTLQIKGSADPQPLGALHRFSWIVVSSANAVETLFARMAEDGLDARDLKGVGLCAIGRNTAQALRARSLSADVAAERYDTVAAVDRIESARGPLKAKAILLPRADIARSSLAKELRARGAELTELPAYRAAIPKDAEELVAALMEFRPQYVTFTSGAAARNFAHILGEARLHTLPEHTAFAAIGPSTASVAEEEGIQVEIVPQSPTIEALVEAICTWDENKSNENRSAVS